MSNSTPSRDPRLIAFLEDEEDEAYRRHREIAPDWRGRWVAHMLKVYSKLG